MRKYKAALFDLDGTLLNTLNDISTAMNIALKKFGLPEFSVDEYRYLVGNGAKILAKRAVRDRQEMAEQVQSAYQEYYGSHTDVMTAPYSGISESLMALSNAGIKLCVLSNKPHQDTVHIIHTYFPDIPFDCVQGQKPEFPIKPDPSAALSIAGRLQIDPEDFMYFGDTSVDMCCAVNAGMTPAGVLWGFRDEKELRSSGSQFILHSPDEIPGLFGVCKK